MERNKFRLDLYYRLNVFPIRIPPLRERKEDITSLLNHFINQMAENYGRQMIFTSTALDALIRYDWPGNVREMQNLIERLVIMSDTERISLEFLKSYLAPGQTAAVQEVVGFSEEAPRHSTLREFERNEVLAALECVTWVCLFGEETPLRLIRKIGPDILVKGGDWPVEKVVGRPGGEQITGAQWSQ